MYSEMGERRFLSLLQGGYVPGGKIYTSTPTRTNACPSSCPSISPSPSYPRSRPLPNAGQLQHGNIRQAHHIIHEVLGITRRSAHSAPHRTRQDEAENPWQSRGLWGVLSTSVLGVQLSGNPDCTQHGCRKTMALAGFYAGYLQFYLEGFVSS